MKRYLIKINGSITRAKTMSKNTIRNLLVDNRGFGMNEILGITLAIIIAALIVLPGLKDFASNVIEKLDTWWKGIEDIFFA